MIRRLLEWPRWGIWLKYVSSDVGAPLLPKLCELAASVALPAGAFVLLDQTLSICAIIIPIPVLVRRRFKRDPTSTLSLLFLTFGTIFWTAAYIHEHLPVPNIAGAELCHQVAGVAVCIFAALMVASYFFRFVLCPPRSQGDQLKVPQEETISG